MEGEMKKAMLLIVLYSLVFCGCAGWKTRQLEEIETSYQNGEITKTEYLSLKLQVDQVVAQRVTAKHYLQMGPRTTHSLLQARQVC